MHIMEPASPSDRAGTGDRRKRLDARPGEVMAGFQVMVTGQVESAQFRGLDNLYCRYTFAYGPDWRIMQGVDHGYSQVAQTGGEDNSVVWNFPLDITFKSTNPYGWPRLIVTVYSQDMFGRYVVAGSGSVLVPTVAGRYTRLVRTFSPASSTWLQAAMGWLTGNLPEFFDSRFLASNTGREVVRVKSTGCVRVSFNVTSRGLASHGYSNGGPPDAPHFETEAPYIAAAAAVRNGAPLSPLPLAGAGPGAAAALLGGTGRLGRTGAGAGAGAGAGGGAAADDDSGAASRPAASATAAATEAGTERPALRVREGVREGEGERESSVRRVRDVDAVSAGGGARERDRDRDAEGRRSVSRAGIRDRDRDRDREEGGGGGAGIRSRLAAVDDEGSSVRERDRDRGREREELGRSRVGERERDRERTRDRERDRDGEGERERDRSRAAANDGKASSPPPAARSGRY